MSDIRAGAASVDITPVDSQFLYGYPHVQRYSTGVHDPLLSSALYLSDGGSDLLFVANDIIFIDKALALRARRRIAERTGVAVERVMITATHTHSGPITAYYVSNEADPVVPKPDPKYLRQLEEGIVEAACRAVADVRAAEIGLCIAEGTGVGTNRRDPAGPADPEVPVLIAREIATSKTIAAMLVCSMHPTVLHEDSTLISGDFPAFTRQYLQQNVFGDCPVLHHMGPSGNQSPRHVVGGQTFEEAARLGELLGQAVERSVAEKGVGSLLCEAPFGPLRQKASDPFFRRDLSIKSVSDGVQLPVRSVEDVAAAQSRLECVKARLDSLRRSEAPRAEVRTAECDWFGAEEAVTLARAAACGKLAAAAEACMPAEVQAFHVGPWCFVGWPGECFVEFALQVKVHCPNTYIISLANGELQGYLVTKEAVRESGYEASNGLFESPTSGDLLVKATLDLLGR